MRAMPSHFLCPSQFSGPQALRFRCSGQAVSLMRNSQCPVPKQAWYSFIDPLRDGRLTRPCPARRLNLGPVVWQRDTLPFGRRASQIKSKLDFIIVYLFI
ncbi:hypothetical protein TNCV_2535861 [Trichonephila clavipes]|nr:hypothetical protein TNCV_2535861 [Trichonephila clavipes]